MTDTTEAPRKGRKVQHVGCSVEGCDDNKHYSRTYCRNHYSRWHRYGDPTYTPDFKNSGKTCIEVDCNAPANVREMCRRHYQTWYYHNSEVGEFNYDHWNVKEVVGYAGAHYRIRRIRGLATNYECVDCKNQATDWSLKADSEDILYGCSRSGGKEKSPYSMNVYDYEPRCSECHKKYDARTGTRSYKNGKYALINQGGAE